MAYVLAVDNSGSLRTQLSTVIDAAKLVVASTQPNEKALLLRFISADKIQTLVNFTSDRRSLVNGLEEMYIEGGLSAIVDAVYFGNEQVAKYTQGNDTTRRSLLLITDGEERASFYKKEQLFARLQETGLQVFIIGFVSELDKRSREKAVNFLSRLADETGGRVFYPGSGMELERIAKEIMTEMRAPYVLGYNSTHATRDGSLRKVRVEIVNQPEGVKLTATARAGYVAPKN